MRIKIDSGHLYYEISDHENLSDGRPILLVIPGGPGLDHKVYKYGLPELEQFAHVIYYDPRGCGESKDFTIETCNLENHAKDIAAIMAFLNLKKISILGTSYGSMVAMQFAVNNSEKIDGLILVAGAPSYHFIDVAKNNLRQQGTKEQIEFCEKYLWPGNFDSDGRVSEFLKLLRPMYSCCARRGETAPSNPHIKYSMAPLNHAFKLNFYNFDLTNKLYDIKCKTLIISGRHDWINDMHFAEIIKEKIKNSKLIIFESGHSIAFDKHDEYIDELKCFMKEIQNEK